MVVDNAGFHSTKNIDISSNIYLLHIPPYSSELNPFEQIWQHLKKVFKNKVFDDMLQLKNWLHEKVRDMNKELIMFITSNHHYSNAFYAGI